MAAELKPGTTVRVTIKKTVTRDSARKTIERLFMLDRAFARPITVRTSSFKSIPKRRGGRIWTKYPNKAHPALERGASATVKVTAQSIRDLASVEGFVDIADQ